MSDRVFFTLISILVLVGMATAEPPATIVIVHGAWGGAHHWQEVADGFAKGGTVVRRASLTGLGERSHLASKEIDLQTHIQDVVNLVEFDDLTSVILIGHSYGGAVISGVADKIPHRIAKLIYLDAHLLDHGESYLTHHPDEEKRLTRRAREAGDGWLIPVDWTNTVRDVPHPLRTLIEPISLTNPARLQIPAAYWLFTDGKDAQADFQGINTTNERKNATSNARFSPGGTTHTAIDPRTWSQH